jgi:heme oxygenase (biliverdin-IX-beta and delta-forming)
VTTAQLLAARGADARHGGGVRSESVRDELRLATRDDHRRLDAHPTMSAVLSGDSGLDGYARVLVAYAGLYRAIETAIDAAQTFLPTGFDWSIRRKLPWLEQDLRHLRRDAAGSGAIALPSFAPIDSRGAAIGVLYPLEGATLGGVAISKRLHQRLGIDALAGGRFFHGYGAETKGRWDATCVAIETIAADASARATAVRHATEVFRCFADALDRAAPDARHEMSGAGR